MKTILFIALFLVFINNANSSGNELLANCAVLLGELDRTRTLSTPEEYLKAGNCLGFVSGVRSTMQLSLAEEKIPLMKVCWPKKGADGEAVRIVVKYLKENPKRLSENKTLLTMTALALAYPCTP